MPEVCEVALTAEILNSKLKSKTITSINFIGGRYSTKDNRKKVGYYKFIKSLPIRIKKVDSKGKFMWFDLVNSKGERWYIWNTFGMTGMWSFTKQKFDACHITTSDGTILYYSDLRRFGTFKFDDDTFALEKKVKILTPDFLKDDFDLDTLLRKHKKPIMNVLTDQKHGSGIGNYLIAEILYHAKISPHRNCDTLTDKEIKMLTYYIKYIIKLCYLCGGTEYMGHLTEEITDFTPQNYHPDIHVKKKDLKKFSFNVYRQPTDPLGNEVVADKRGERTMYWVPDVQK